MAGGNSNSAVCKLTPEQAASLRRLLEERGWEFVEAPAYADFKAMHERTVLIYYTSGKLVIQGRGTQDFISFILEPEILHTFDFTLAAGSASSLVDAGPITPHGGIDESGKGDFFGPLVVAGVSVDAVTGEALRSLGVCDSKLINSSARIRELARGIRQAAPGHFAVLELKPETYNRLYAQFGNLNRMLAWGHATVIEKLLELDPGCPRMLSDKFANEILLRRALKTRGRTIKLEQRCKAESDVAVAAASILAREGFLCGMYRLGEELGVTLPRGAGSPVKRMAEELFRRDGHDVFVRCAKLHFKTYAEITGDRAYIAPEE